jgi:hypothetical protein
MNFYKAKLEVLVEVQAFNEEDVADYINDIFNIDEEIKSVKIVQIRQK